MSHLLWTIRAIYRDKYITIPLITDTKLAECFINI